MDAFANLALGFSVALAPDTLLFCFLGVFVGTFIGVLPGLGPLATISMLLPLTFHLQPVQGLVMLAGVYYGAQYGGSTASILLNLPGTASTAVTCIDGYPMTRQGRGGVALAVTTVASFVGGLLGVAALVALAPTIVGFALMFGAPEYFALMLLGLLSASMLAQGSPVRGVAMVLFGLVLGVVGTDVNSGQMRFTFGFLELADGLSLVAVAMGLFGVSEVLANAGRIATNSAPGVRITWRSMVPTRDDVRRSGLPLARSGLVGVLVGALPGAGATVASFLAYTVEKRSSREPERFGRGAVEGVVAPESANNAAAQAAFIPTMTLGIPGDAVMALMLGALMIHGILPGPDLIGSRPELFWGLIASFVLGNVMLLILNLPLVGIWVRLVTIPYRVLYPAVLVLICIGVYSVNNSVFDIFVLIAAGLVGYGMLLLKFEPAPLLLGLILGPMMEENLRRALILSRGDPTVFLTRPISAVLIGCCVLLVAWAVWSARRPARAAA